MNDYSKIFRLDGKNALVTGASGILGREFCRGLAAAGASVALVDRDANTLEQVTHELQREFPQKFCAYHIDIADPHAVAELRDAFERDFVEIHILHNNAATKTDSLENFLKPFEEYDFKTWRDVMSVNIDAMFLMAQAVGKHMIERGIHGSIIQTGSIYGIVAPDQRIYEGSLYMNRTISSPAVYSASKAAVVGLSQYLAAYWGHKGIRVNTLVPGGNQSGQNETFLRNYSRRVPLGRMGHPSEMVGALIYLASDASRYVTGQCLAVDGGLTAW